MPRLRIIRPNYTQLPAVGRLSREARLLHILLWPVADDAGRLRLDPDQLVEQLYPFDEDASFLLPSWLDELERERCIERYAIDGAAYLPRRELAPAAEHSASQTQPFARVAVGADPS